ncbi:MAG TPA: shikimate kinase [Pyrinomonadaceae bacterium]|nr:shikimate kinase [Pyrinomonadaceae bacterium]
MPQDNNGLKVALTGFMGVGKSSVARHLASLLRTKRLDLDRIIEQSQGKTIARIIDDIGIDKYRDIETENLTNVVGRDDFQILSLGGGTWTLERNREILRANGFTSVWLEATFEHCWLNIAFSRKDRPLARNKEGARQLFEERQKIYCLADWHFIIRSGLNSYDIARQIREEIFS